MKIIGLLFALFIGHFHNKWIKVQLNKVHKNIEYILSYEGLTGLFDDVQRLKRIMLYYVLETTAVNTQRIDELEIQLKHVKEERDKHVE